MSQKQWTEDKDDGLVPRNGYLEGYEQRGEESGVGGGTVRGRLIQEMQAERNANLKVRPGGPNRSAKYDMGASAKVYGLRALATIVEIMENVGESSAVRLAAAREVLDRGFGRPKQSMEVGGVDGDEIRNRLIIEFVGVPRREVPHGYGAEGDVGADRSSEMRTADGGSRALENMEEVDLRRGRGAPTKADLEEAGIADWRVLPRPRVKVAKEAIRTVGQVNAAWVEDVATGDDV